jgi:hypothetical protein
MRYEVHSHALAAYMPAFPKRTDTHFEITNLSVCNPPESTAEHEELIYEVSWIEELGMWRRFLISRRVVRN